MRPFSTAHGILTCMDEVHLDFETRSTVPFGRAKGAVTAYQYARHPSTGIWCMSWAINDGEVMLWDPFEDEPFPDDILYALREGVRFTAHNAGFEYQIWNNVLAPRWGLPALPIEQMDCTAARAAVMALPRSLEGAAMALGLEFQKDKAGAALMTRMAKPRKPRKDEDPNGLYWWDDRERRQRLGRYCVQDTVVERELGKIVRPLSDSERRVWLMDHRTNMRGVEVDTELAARAQRIMAFVDKRYVDEITTLTNGSVTAPTEVQAIKNWAEGQGCDIDSLNKVVLGQMLDDDSIPEQVKAVLRIRQEAGKSSVAKFIRFEQLTSADGRMRENYLYHGANTGRLAGKGAQLQNLPSRGGLGWRDAEEVIQLIHEVDDPGAAADQIEVIYGDVPTALSSCLRGTLTAAPGKQLFVADYSNIEGRVAAWLGDERWKLEAFRAYDTIIGVDERGKELRAGPDLYKVTAGSILGTTPERVDDVQRNVMGKVPELALGFGGGFGAFQSMAKIYGVNMADYWDIVQAALAQEFIDRAWANWDKFGKKSGAHGPEWLASEAVKLGWRARHKGIVRCWYDAEKTAFQALENPGKWFKFAGGKCAHGSAVYGGVPFLISRLPSGRRIYRANAQLRPVKKFGRASQEIRFHGVDSVTKQWVRMSTYGGDLFQSFVQAIARDIMINGWANLEQAEYDVVLSVHDELGAEGEPERDLDEFVGLMTDLPDWAAGCPVSATGYKSYRYRKD